MWWQVVSASDVMSYINVASDVMSQTGVASDKMLYIKVKSDVKCSIRCDVIHKCSIRCDVIHRCSISCDVIHRCSIRCDAIHRYSQEIRIPTTITTKRIGLIALHSPLTNETLRCNNNYDAASMRTRHEVSPFLLHQCRGWF